MKAFAALAALVCAATVADASFVWSKEDTSVIMDACRTHSASKDSDAWCNCYADRLKGLYPTLNAMQDGTPYDALYVYGFCGSVFGWNQNASQEFTSACVPALTATKAMDSSKVQKTCFCLTNHLSSISESNNGSATYYDTAQIKDISDECAANDSPWSLENDKHFISGCTLELQAHDIDQTQKISQSMCSCTATGTAKRYSTFLDAATKIDAQQALSISSTCAARSGFSDTNNVALYQTTCAYLQNMVQGATTESSESLCQCAVEKLMESKPQEDGLTNEFLSPILSSCKASEKKGFPVLGYIGVAAAIAALLGVCFVGFTLLRKKQKFQTVLGDKSTSPSNYFETVTPSNAVDFHPRLTSPAVTPCTPSWEFPDSTKARAEEWSERQTPRADESEKKNNV